MYLWVPRGQSLEDGPQRNCGLSPGSGRNRALGATGQPEAAIVGEKVRVVCRLWKYFPGPTVWKPCVAWQGNGSAKGSQGLSEFGVRTRKTQSVLRCDWKPGTIICGTVKPSWEGRRVQLRQPEMRRDEGNSPRPSWENKSTIKDANSTQNAVCILFSAPPAIAMRPLPSRCHWSQKSPWGTENPKQRLALGLELTEFDPESLE